MQDAFLKAFHKRQAQQEPIESLKAKAELTIEFYRKLREENAALKAEVKALKARLKKRR